MLPQEIEVLRESVRSRAAQSLPGGVALFAVLVVLAAALYREAGAVRLVAWELPLAAAMALRMALARRILGEVGAATVDTLGRHDATLRYSSMANQALCGAGIWIVGWQTGDFVAFFITLTITLFGVGAMINLSADYRSFRVSLPLLMAQPIAFWLLQGYEGLRIAFPLTALSILMMSQARNGARVMAESVRMRFEKSGLLERVERERSATEDALKLAREAMRARAMFLAAASHDLRQPLYALSLLSDTLASEPLAGQAPELVDKQRQAIAALRALFDNLLDLSRFDAGEIRPSLRPSSLPDLLAPLCMQYEMQCRAKGLSWRADIDAAWVNTDAGLLQRLVGNLLSNAVRYTGTGEVRLVARARGAHVEMSVEDSGPGIAHQDLERVFEEFVQLGNAQRDREQGVGLGLSIVRRIAGLLDAGLEVESTVGKGTCLRLRVPIAEAGSVAHAPPHGTRPSEATFRGVRAWILEDDVLVREALLATLRSWGMQCEAGVRRADLLRLHEAAGAWPDVAIIDDMLGPDENGLDVARWLSGYVPDHRILLQTGNVDPDRRAELETSGFVVFLKPLASQDLAEWVADAMRVPPSGFPAPSARPE
jgi:signal transduction histidine kinase/CheY-like chemotaxis protein